ncbi:MAG: cytochrome c biogenesis protein CcdA [Candidatus Omnitrophica bacterium]|nr:cytochrome c biogenesis protein CcdA [Candidatus Omnitrophota bacterium]
MENVNYLTAAIAGLVSFLSPCVLPLIPAYISYISGTSLQELRDSGASARITSRVFFRTLWFVIGFSAVFVLLGASATAFGRLLLQQIAVLRQTAGVILVIFGLHLIGIFKIPFLLREKKLEVKTRPASAAGAFVVGAAFGFGWTPCLGPILAGILAIASMRETVGEGMGLLLVYSLGLGFPFLATSLAISQFLRFLNRVRWLPVVVERLGGLLLVVVGVAMITNWFVRWAAYFQSIPFFSRFNL